MLEAFGSADHAAERDVSPHVGGAQTASSVTEQDIAGLIIATQEDRVSVSTGDTVILDQGRLQGVEVGDRYAVFEGGRTILDPRTGRLIRVPRDVIGELTVVRVYERTAKAQIRRSSLEVNAGAPIAPCVRRWPVKRVVLRRQTSRCRRADTGVSLLREDTADAAEGRIRQCQSRGPGGRQGCSGQC